jgi:hypothetical protein
MFGVQIAGILVVLVAALYTWDYLTGSRTGLRKRKNNSLKNDARSNSLAPLELTTKTEITTDIDYLKGKNK